MSSPSPRENASDPSRLLLVLGVQRSGTTLLAAMLGRHSEINMLFESATDDVKRLIGKRYRGNKLLTARQIHPTRRASRFGHLVNRLANLDVNPFRPRHHKRRLFPLSRLSIEDYRSQGSAILCISRREQDVVSSIVKRTSMDERLARAEYRRGMEQMRELKEEAFWVDYDELVVDPEGTMQRVCGHLGLEYDERMLEGARYNVVYPHEKVLAEKASSAIKR